MKLILKYARFFSKKSPKVKQQVSPELQAELNSQRIQHLPNRQLPSNSRRNILITSALPYVNNTPHLGNIIGAVLSADVYARFCRMMGYNVLFICGTDEYGTATEVKALKEGTTPRAICDKYHTIHKSIYQWFDISFDHFGRTSCDAHTHITQDIFKHLLANDAVTEKISSQLYCSHCDLFLADRFVHGTCKKCGSATRGDQCESCSSIFNSLTQELNDLKCSVCSNTPTPRQTKHFYLKLGQESKRLKKWLIDEGGVESWTNNAKGVTKGWLISPPQDRCITRDLKWGVPVPHPGYEKKVFYVWFQAPIGYISITADYLKEGYRHWWLPEESNQVELRQFMGKDNILFHSIINPASLIATGQKWIKPTHLSVTQYLKYEGGKFSKSHNIGVFGDQCKQTGIPVDCWRYYLLRVRPQSYDSEFSWSDFAQKCNKQLLNNIGNLVQRVLKYSFKSFGSKILPLSENDLEADQLHLLEQFSTKYKQYLSAMEKTQLMQGATLITQLSDSLNQYVSKTEFWRNPRKQLILGFMMRMLRVYSLLLEPFVPALAAKMNYLLGCPSQTFPAYTQMNDLKAFMLNCLMQSKGLREPIPLFSEITAQQISVFKAKYGTNTI